MPKYLPHYTAADYQQWEGEWELWNGIAVSMTPSPFGRHQWIAGQILSRFNQQLRQQGCKDCFALSETDWVVAPDTIVRPDVVIVCGVFPERYIETPPRVIVEVLSDSTAQKDRTAKYELYQREGVKYYLLVDPQLQTSELYEQTLDQHYKKRATDQPFQLHLHDDCQLQLDLSETF